MFGILDEVRRAEGVMLERLGFGPIECRYRIVASRRHWRLRNYAGSRTGPGLLIIAAPIKRPYIWDLAPSVSAVRFCLDRGLRVYLLEWTFPSPGNGNVGLAKYADQAIGEAVVRLVADTGTQPFLVGHSLGGTFAAIFGALAPEAARGLVLLGAPLCFRPGISRFRDAIVAIAPSDLAEMEVVPGSLLSQLSAWASPETFLWSRLLDAMVSSADPAACVIHARVERWALDEVPLPARLVQEILHGLYREDRLCQGNLSIGERIAGPSQLRLPTLAVVNPRDEIAPPASVLPFIEAMPGRDVRVLDYAGELGVGIQHLGILVGRQAYEQVWPEIISWLNAER
jgi:polyhydroxyalkanoate synthase subunit PhaC